MILKGFGLDSDWNATSDDVPPTLPTGRRRCYYCDALAVEISNDVPRCATHAKPFEKRKT